VEYGWSPQEFLEHACEKAGLPRDSWRDESTEVLRFGGTVFREG
jgi:AMMECR1 domain-containing protein